MNKKYLIILFFLSLRVTFANQNTQDQIKLLTSQAKQSNLLSNEAIISPQAEELLSDLDSSINKLEEQASELSQSERFQLRMLKRDVFDAQTRNFRTAFTKFQESLENPLVMVTAKEELDTEILKKISQFGTFKKKFTEENSEKEMIDIIQKQSDALITALETYKQKQIKHQGNMQDAKNKVQQNALDKVTKMRQDALLSFKKIDPKKQQVEALFNQLEQAILKVEESSEAPTAASLKTIKSVLENFENINKTLQPNIVKKILSMLRCQIVRVKKRVPSKDLKAIYETYIRVSKNYNYLPTKEDCVL